MGRAATSIAIARRCEVREARPRWVAAPSALQALGVVRSLRSFEVCMFEAAFTASNPTMTTRVVKRS